MKRAIICFIVLLFVGVNAVHAQEQAVQTLQPGTWLKNWLLVGPIPLEKKNETSGQWKHISGFETDFLKSVGGEANPKIKKGTNVKFRGGKARCLFYNSPDSIVNLDKALSNESLVLAYGYTEIESPEDKVMILGLGTNDGCRVWLNGIQILDVPTERGLSVDDDLIPVSLKKGKNTLLIKGGRTRRILGILCPTASFFSFKIKGRRENCFLLLRKTTVLFNSKPPMLKTF